MDIDDDFSYLAAIVIISVASRRKKCKRLQTKVRFVGRWGKGGGREGWYSISVTLLVYSQHWLKRIPGTQKGIWSIPELLTISTITHPGYSQYICLSILGSFHQWSSPLTGFVQAVILFTLTLKFWYDFSTPLVWGTNRTLLQRSYWTYCNYNLFLL